jgi:hypothetical protein
MTIAGWIFMIASVGFVTALAGFCFYRVLTTPSATERMRAPLDIIDEREAAERGRRAP